VQPYRFRSWLRAQLPQAAAEQIPKGKDCGQGHHEWYLSEDRLWGCYHCVQTTKESPWSSIQWARLRMRAIYTDLAFMAASDLPPGEFHEIRLGYRHELDQLEHVVSSSVAGQGSLPDPELALTS